MRSEYPISKNWNGSDSPMTIYVEMACNNMFGAGKNGMISKGLIMGGGGGGVNNH